MELKMAWLGMMRLGYCTGIQYCTDIQCLLVFASVAFFTFHNMKCLSNLSVRFPFGFTLGYSLAHP